MGFFDKFKFDKDSYGGDDIDDEEFEEVEDDYEMAEEIREVKSKPEVSRESIKQGGVDVSNAALELKVVRPERFDAVPQIADHLLNRRTIVLNLEGTNKETARRLIDFLSGVAYSIDGQMKKVASNTYVITPKNVDVTGESFKKDTREKEAGDTSSKAAGDDFYDET